jgi:hypothetical protein
MKKKKVQWRAWVWRKEKGEERKGKRKKEGRKIEKINYLFLEFVIYNLH